MKSFCDLLETVTPASSSDAERNLTTATAVKTALRIATTDYDSLIGDLIPRVSQNIVNYCRLAKDAAGAEPTFARETLRATWHADCDRRGAELYLPWRLPLYTVDSVVEDGTALVAGTDFVVVGARPARLRRMSGDSPVDWKSGKIVVTFKAGFAATMSGTIDNVLEAAAIEQMSGAVFAAGRDPSIKSESTDDVGTVSYTSPGGDMLGALTAPYLLPSVRDMLAPWRNPLP